MRAKLRKKVITSTAAKKVAKQQGHEKPFERKKGIWEENVHDVVDLARITSSLTGFPQRMSHARLGARARRGAPLQWKPARYTQRVLDHPLVRHVGSFIDPVGYAAHRAVDYAFDPKGAYKEAKTRRALKEGKQFIRSVGKGAKWTAYAATPFGMGEVAARYAMNEKKISRKTFNRIKKGTRAAAAATAVGGAAFVGYHAFKDPYGGPRLRLKDAARSAKYWKDYTANSGRQAARWVTEKRDNFNAKYRRGKTVLSGPEPARWENRGDELPSGWKTAKNVTPKKVNHATTDKRWLTRYRKYGRDGRR